MRLVYGCVLLSLLFLSACVGTSKTFILTGFSTANNANAVMEAQQAINNAQQNGCRAFSLGGGTGAGAGIGTGVGLGVGLAKKYDVEQFSGNASNVIVRADTLVRVDTLAGATYAVHVLVKCPEDAPDLLANGLPVPGTN